MADVFDGPFGTYTDITGVTNATAKGDIATNLINLAALMGVTLTAGDGVTGAYVLLEEAGNPSPDFDAIRVEYRDKLGTEFAALWDSIDAGPEA